MWATEVARHSEAYRKKLGGNSIFRKGKGTERLLPRCGQVKNAIGEILGQREEFRKGGR